MCPTQNKATAEEATPRVSEERLAELLDVAAEVFFEHGFAAASVGEMARRARASKGTYYSRYATKSDLFEAIIRRRSDVAMERIQEIFHSGGAVQEILREFCRQLLKLTLSPEAISLLRLLYMEARHFPELGKAFYEHGYGRIQNCFVAYLKDQVGKGTLRIDNIPLVAEQFVDGLIGGLSRRLALAVDSVPSRREQDLRIATALGAFFAAYGS